MPYEWAFHLPVILEGEWVCVKGTRQLSGIHTTILDSIGIDRITTAVVHSMVAWTGSTVLCRTYVSCLSVLLGRTCASTPQRHDSHHHPFDSRVQCPVHFLFNVHVSLTMNRRERKRQPDAEAEQVNIECHTRTRRGVTDAVVL